MAKRQTYIVRGEVFRTKSELQERVKRILWSYKDGQTLATDDFEFMLDLLQNHPRAETKKVAGVAYMLVKKNPIYHGTRSFYLVRHDGTETDFSYIECITPTPKRKKVKMACRVLVEPYTIEFKRRFFDERGGAAICELTREEIHFIGSHVDHVPPKTFDALFAQFICYYDIDIEAVEFKDECVDNKIQDELADENLSTLWVKWHNEHAELRVVSKRANLSHVKTLNKPNA